MSSKGSPHTIYPIQKALLRTLLYFDVFHFPLTQKELHQYSSISSTIEELSAPLEELVRQGLIFQYNDSFLLQEKPDLVQQKEENYLRALGLIHKGFRLSKRLARFPFVRGISLSGSISKYSADKNADIDYFIITAPNRLWIARTFMHAFKKFTFLFGKQHDYCMNYYIDTAHLDIQDKNIYTAIEVATIIPTVDKDIYHQFIDVNQWIQEYLPNFKVQDTQQTLQNKSWIRRFSEWFLDNRFGDWLNHYLMNWIDKKWRKYWIDKKKYPEDEYNSAMQTNTHVSKNHPDNYQQKVLEKFEARIATFEQEHSIDLSESSYKSQKDRGL